MPVTKNSIQSYPLSLSLATISFILIGASLLVILSKVTDESSLSSSLAALGVGFRVCAVPAPSVNKP
ncbi:hypothetical protein [Pseudoalteromonas sp. TB64]|uniref:hypothetical protein n=1 Tax=Pseudoalteromonas sp. TB64 TaxID=1938600 RepID=UPI0020A6319F|nr:hypothetical protein [Pseudoalteromonas sp. TB64]